MLDFTIEKAKASDALRISVLLKTVYINTYGMDGISWEFANFMEKRFSPSYIENCIAQDDANLLVAMHKGNPIGVAEIIIESKCRYRNKVQSELSKLYVLNHFFGHGIGSTLLNQMEKTLVSKGKNSLFLEVWAENNEAISFYKHQGYSFVGEVNFPMEENIYLNHVMQKKLN